MSSPGVCGWCLTGQCCADARAFATFTCTHTERCNMPGGVYTIRWPGAGWCSMHGKDHRAKRCDEVNEEGIFMATLVEQAWAQLDAEMDEIAAETNAALVGSSPASEARLALLKARARGKAEILLLFMAPHYATTDDIAIEASRRKWHRDQGLDYTSLGMGTRRTEGL